MKKQVGASSYTTPRGITANGGLEPNEEIHDIALVDMKSIPPKVSTVRIPARWQAPFS